MSDRYTRVFGFANRIYCENCPLVICAGAILFDKISNRVLAQVKYESISEKVISYVRVRIIEKDTAGRVICEKTSKAYMDLDLKRGEVFGSNAPIVLNPETRAFDVLFEEVVFSDQTVWVPKSNSYKVIPKQRELSRIFSDEEIVKQYKIETGSSGDYVISAFEDLWICSCGALNHSYESLCAKCKANANVLSNYLNEDLLVEGTKERISRERRELVKQKKREKARNRNIIIICVVGLILSLAISIGVNAIKKAKINAETKERYNQGVEHIENGEYEKAVHSLSPIKDYKDAEKQLTKARYLLGVEYYNKGKYAAALTTFKMVEDYKDSKDYIEKCRNK